MTNPPHALAAYPPDAVGQLPIEVSDPPDPAAWDVLAKALDRHNAPFAGPSDYAPVVLLVRGTDGAILGGLWGRTLYRWLHVWFLVLPEAMRGQGLGTRLMLRAEEVALERGCIGSLVDTLSFQARPFYERLGYEVYGTIEDAPPGHSTYFLRKRLRPSATAPAAAPGSRTAASHADDNASLLGATAVPA